MIYGLSENPTKEELRSQYIIVNMRFKELQSQMEPHHKLDSSRLLRYVREDLRKQSNPEAQLPEHVTCFLMLAEGIISGYRKETQRDIETAEELSRELNLRHIDLKSGSIDRKVGFYLGGAVNALDDFDPQHPETRTYAIDKVMHNLGEAEKLIVEAEKQQLVGVR